MSLPKNLKEIPELSQWDILTGYRGSIAHGMYVPKSDPNSIDDKDIMSIIVPPKDYYLGLKKFGSKGTKEIKYNEWDIVIYEVKKFLGLLEKGNPNVLLMLWLDKTDYIKVTKEGELLISYKDLFVNKNVYHSFVGYAYSQLHRMTHCKHQGYMGEKRKRLVEKFGYDTKNASHLIRLLRMGIEFLIEGYLHVKRKDSSQLLEIKRGEWSLEQVKKEANHLFKLAEEAYVRSSLPNKPDTEKINELCIKILESKFKNGTSIY